MVALEKASKFKVKVPDSSHIQVTFEAGAMGSLHAFSESLRS